MTRYAFLIGCEEYSNFSNIAFCESDVGLVQETLVDYCDYEYKNIERSFQYKGCDDTPIAIYDKLQTMIDNAEMGDSILFYFAGHGVKEGEKGYLLLADSKSSDFQNTALDLAQINELLRKSNIEGFLILDACHSGIFAINALNSSVSDIISDTGCVTLASCAANEESHPYPEKQQGVFTYYLCEEIKKISSGTPVFIEGLKIEVCNSVTQWAKKNYKNQTPTLNGQIVGNKAIAYRNHKNYLFVEDERLSGRIVKDEPKLLYTTVLEKWLKDNSELQIKNIMLENREWRVYGQYYVYMAHDKNDVPWIVMLNILEKYNYSNVLHTLNNIKVISNYYSKFGKKYGYYQLILISQNRQKELYKMINNHTKLQRIYNNQEIKNTVVYLNDGKFNYISSNYDKKVKH